MYQSRGSNSKIKRYTVGNKKSSEAEDSVNLHKKRIKIGNLMMEVVQGDITEERTDVIVNSTNESLNLVGGNLSAASPVYLFRYAW